MWIRARADQVGRYGQVWDHKGRSAENHGCKTESARSFYVKSESSGDVSREVHDEIAVAGAGLPGAGELQRANWIRVRPNPSESSPEVKAACAGLGAGERSIIYLASALAADLTLIDEGRARRAA